MYQNNLISNGFCLTELLPQIWQISMVSLLIQSLLEIKEIVPYDALNLATLNGSYKSEEPR